MTALLTFINYMDGRVRSQGEDGSVAIEYALLATLIAVAIILAVTGVGTRLIAKFDAVTF